MVVIIILFLRVGEYKVKNIQNPEKEVYDMQHNVFPFRSDPMVGKERG